MNRIFHTATRPFRAVASWQADRGSWLSISLRDQYQVVKAVDRVAEGRLTDEQADAQLRAYAERREQEAYLRKGTRT